MLRQVGFDKMSLSCQDLQRLFIRLLLLGIALLYMWNGFLWNEYEGVPSLDCTEPAQRACAGTDVQEASCERSASERIASGSKTMEGGAR